MKLEDFGDRVKMEVRMCQVCADAGENPFFTNDDHNIKLVPCESCGKRSSKGYYVYVQKTDEWVSRFKDLMVRKLEECIMDKNRIKERDEALRREKGRIKEQIMENVDQARKAMIRIDAIKSVMGKMIKLFIPGLTEEDKIINRLGMDE